MMNILVGGNDSGKSNFLRALNLFFNGEVENAQPFRFSRDFSRSATTGKGKAQEVRIELTFTPPANYQSDEAIVWRKCWRADSSSPSLDERVLVSRREISGRSKVHAWLDAHRYYYVPAVRGADYFRSLMRDVHDTLAESYESELRDSSNAFVKDLRRHTRAIGRVVKEQLGIGSEIQLPPDLRSLFEVLDFETDDRISFRQRGDGIQAAHIPAILKFLADAQLRLAAKGRPLPTCIWGYEEPENNLEFTRAFSIAEQLFEYSASHQIFVTSHSPAFYAGRSSAYRPTRWQVKIQSGQSNIEGVSDSSSDELHDLVGLMPIIAPFVREVQSQVEAMRDRLSTLTKPTIFVAGVTDEKYVKRALRIFEPKRSRLVNVKFIGRETATGSANGGDGNLEKLVAVFREQGELIPYRSVALFDCDTNKRAVDYAAIRVQPIPKNPANKLQKKGIENALSSDLFLTEFFETRTESDPYGGTKVITSLNKVLACDAICAMRDESLSEAFAHLREPLSNSLDFLVGEGK